MGIECFCARHCAVGSPSFSTGLVLRASDPGSGWRLRRGEGCLAAEQGLCHSDPEIRFRSRGLTVIKCSAFGGVNPA